MKINDKTLNDILEEAKYEFETCGVYLTTKNWSEDGFNIDVRYNDIDNDLDGLQLFMGDTEVNLSDEQLNIIFLFLVDLYNQELESEAEHKRRSCDLPDGYHLFI